MFESKVLRKIFGPTRDEVTDGIGEDCITRSSMICTPHQILLGWSHQEERGCLGMCNVWGTGDMRKEFWRGDLREGSPGRPRRRWEGNVKIELDFIKSDMYFCISNPAHLMHKTKEVARTFSVVIRLCH